MTFDEAVIKRLGYTGDWEVGVEPEEYHWDGHCWAKTCGAVDGFRFNLYVKPMKRTLIPAKPRSDGTMTAEWWFKSDDPDRGWFEHTFYSFPEVWAWLDGGPLPDVIDDSLMNGEEESA